MSSEFETFTSDAVQPTMEPGCSCMACMALRESAGDGQGGLDGTKPVWSTDQIVGQFLRSNAAWSPGATITYSFRNSTPPGSDADLAFVPFSAIERQMTRLGFDLVSDLVNLNFVEAPDDGRATGISDRIYLGKDSAAPDFEWGHAQRWTVPTGGRRLITAAEIYVSDAAQANRAWFVGGYNFQALTHEILHTLGIPHPGNYNADGNPITYAANAEYAQDSRQFTIMSYFAAGNTGSDHQTDGESGGLWSSFTPLLHDIAALQALYGANTATRNGDTVYGYGSNAGRALFDFDAASQPVLTPDGRLINPAPIFTIWDGGGTDRLDFSRTNLSVNADLNPGAFSDAFGMTNNISIAFGAVIENAVGGSANDRLAGNEAANYMHGGDGDDEMSARGGADFLEGGAGNDRLFGQDGDDLIGGQGGDDYINGGQGRDSLHGDGGNDFLEGGADADRLFGQDGDDLIGGQDGEDYMHGGQGRDSLYGDGGADFLEGGSGNDRLFGQDGDDLIGGQEGDDYINGGQGRDSLYGDGGADFLEGGGDNDRLFGQDGDDLIGGQDGDDYLDGGEGRDLLFGDAGSDFLEGRGGDDRLDGQDGDDLIGGQDGDDYLVGGAGRDAMFGDAGADTLFGGEGADYLSGGAGADRFLFTALSQSVAGQQDRIIDFDPSAGDLIDLSQIDADPFAGGDQGFELVSGFSGRSGHAVLSFDGRVTTLLLDVDGDRSADFILELEGRFDGRSGFLL